MVAPRCSLGPPCPPPPPRHLSAVSALPALKLLWGILSPRACRVALSQRSVTALGARGPGGSPRGLAAFPSHLLGLPALGWSSDGSSWPGGALPQALPCRWPGGCGAHLPECRSCVAGPRLGVPAGVSPHPPDPSSACEWARSLPLGSLGLAVNQACRSGCSDPKCRDTWEGPRLAGGPTLLLGPRVFTGLLRGSPPWVWSRTWDTAALRRPLCTWLRA